MELKIKKEYPCGYKWELEYNGFTIPKKINMETICPIHKEKCGLKNSLKK